MLRRLNLTAHAAPSPDKSIAYFDNVLQLCDVGILSAPLHHPATRTNPPADRMPFGGRKRPLKLGLQCVRDWMQICVDEHGQSCTLKPAQVDRTQQASMERPKHQGFPLIRDSINIIRLIDVHRHSIRELHNLKLDEIKFMALSYVWGSNSTVRLANANRTALQKSASLRDLNLQRTIADSIRLVDELGLKYLWVDALCIIQDDAKDQSYQIGKIATIYSAAFLTIVAASGEDSNAGLPGFGSSSRLFEQQEVVVYQPSEHNAGLSFMNTLKSYPRHWDEWYTRGQEDADVASGATVPGQCKKRHYCDVPLYSPKNRCFGTVSKLISARSLVSKSPDFG